MTSIRNEQTKPPVADAMQAAQRFQAVFEAAPSAIAMVESEGAIVLANHEMERMFGYARGELTGQPSERLIAASFPGRHEAFRPTQSGMKASESRREVLGRRKDGTEFPLTLGLSRIELPEGPLVLASVLHVSERRSIEKALHQTIEELRTQSGEAARQATELRRANDELEEFSYAASHDLREPLRNLLSYVELLQEDCADDLPDEAAQDLEFITTSAARMQRLVDDLLRLSRAGRAKINKEEVPLEDCVGNCLKALAASLESNQVSFEGDPLPTVLGDRDLLTQLYQNLLANAAKFHRSGMAPRIQITAEDRGTDWLLGVRDNGIGIASRHATDIFAPFKRLHGMGEFEGTGVGLAICRKAVERHGGRIWVESEPGQGAYFRFTLPVEES